MNEIRASDVREGERIMWAGHQCIVTRVEREPRAKWAHRVWMTFDLDVPGLPPRTNVAYSPGEMIETWEAA